jgi:thiamine-phosphate pyrophosphorylase
VPTKTDYSLYLVTDRTWLHTRTLCEVIEEAATNGVTVVQLREKSASSREMYELGKAVHEVTRAHGIPLIINDRVDIMLALDAEGVHVGPEDLPVAAARALAGGKIIGTSVNSPDDLAKAHAEGADYIGIGPVFATSTKKDTRHVLGVNGLKKLVHETHLPCVAIGGINAENAGAVIQTDVTGVCSISGILAQPDVGRAVREFRDLLDQRGEKLA